MTALLRLTDGTTTVDLLKGRKGHGFRLRAWTPTVPELKGGGVWQDSPMAEGRQLADYVFGNVRETLELSATGPDTDVLVRELQDMRRLLDKARAYWKTRWQGTPVYLMARGLCETNTRYALVYDGTIPADANPYHQPFLQSWRGSLMDGLTLQIERGHWTEAAPGTLTSIEASNPGRAATNTDEVFVANMSGVGAITDIYYYDASAMTYSGNLVGAALPYALLPAVPDAGDIVYFGNQSSYPFSSLVFDLQTAAVDLTVVDWKYCTNAVGPVFTVLNKQDNTNAAGLSTGQPFDTAGVNSVHWAPPTAPVWVTCSINGVAGFWVCAEVSAHGAAPAPPIQQHRDVYTVVWPYVQVEAEQVPGDIPALMTAHVRNVSDRVTGGNAITDLYSNRCIAGLRSLSRGSNFRAYINLGNTQNPAGITVATDDALGQTNFASLPKYPTGIGMAYVPATTPATPQRRFYIEIDNTISNQFYGTYRAFLRCDGATTLGFVTGYVSTTVGLADPDHVSIYTSPTFTLPTSCTFYAVDIGQIDIGASGQVLSTEGEYSLRFHVWLTSSVAAGSMVFTDLILIPIDEFAYDVRIDNSNVSDDHTGCYVDYSRYYDIDSIGHPKFASRAWVKNDSNLIVQPLVNVTNGAYCLQANRQQRWWFLFGGAASTVWSPHDGHRVQLWRAARYLSMRGDR